MNQMAKEVGGPTPVAGGQPGDAWREAANLGRMALPIAAVGLVNLAMSITDMLMMARLDSRALVIGAIIGDVYSLAIQFGNGALSALVAPIAAACATGQRGKVGQRLAEGLVWSVVLGVAGSVLVCLSPAILGAVGLQLTDLAAGYSGYMAGAFVFMMMVALARTVMPALGLGRIPLYVMASAIPLNAIADAALMYGWGGLPAMGLAGAGAASLVVAASAAAALIGALFVSPNLRGLAIGRRLLRARPTWKMARAGLLTGTMSLSETGIFLSSTAVVGYLAIESVPAHVAVFRSVAITYVMSVGLGHAITIRAAAAAASASREVVTVARAARIAVLTLMPLCLLFLMLAPKGIGAVMGVDEVELEALVPWAAVTVCALLLSGATYGFHRASGAVRAPAVVGVASYWVIGFGAIVGLAGWIGWGGEGVWTGLALGSIATALGMIACLWRKTPAALPVSQAILAGKG